MSGNLSHWQYICCRIKSKTRFFAADNTEDIERHLAVRDYLRTHKKDRDEYGRLKEKLALAFPNDINGYCDGKNSFMKELEKKAILWKRMEEQK